MEILDVWSKFKEHITVFPDFKDALNLGCNLEDLAEIEDQIDLIIPSDFKTIYLTNNGQKGNIGGIFIASSGYSKFSKLYFLELKKIPITLERLKDVDVFDSGMIPFAVDDEGDSMDDVYCINSKTGEINLLWVAAIDWTITILILIKKETAKHIQWNYSIYNCYFISMITKIYIQQYQNIII